MLSFLVFLLIALAVVTVVGHGLWVMLAAIGRAVFSEWSQPSPSKSAKRPDLHEDLAAMRRLIAYFRQRGWVDETESQRLKDLVDQGERTPFAVSQPPVSRSPVSQPPVSQSPVSQSPVSQPPAQQPLHPLDDPAPLTTPLQSPNLSPQSPVTAASNPVPTPITAAPTIPASPSPQASAPARALSEVLQSFLVAHNIRWGELTAGILIVVCSIGLVISLWNTLTQVNRLIPAAIFLFAVAGIEAAGLYTLNRWKLRQTSRAVLIIATMLVPLSMIAGVSIAGRGEEAVSLQSWSTWLAITASWLISTGMIYFSGRALVGKHRRMHWLVGLGIPTIMLPIVPAAVRFGQVHATWLLVGASVTVLILLLRSSQRITAFRGRRLLPANLQDQYLFAGLATYNILLLAAMLLVRFEPSVQAVVLFTIATIPCLFGLLALSTSLRCTLLSSGKRIAATSLFLIVSTLIVTPFPFVAAETIWLALWGLAVSGSALLVALVTRQRASIAWLSFAGALVLPPLATIYFGDIASPTSLLLWQRYISGYGSVSLILVGLASHAAAILTQRQESRTDQQRLGAIAKTSILTQDRLSQFATAILFTGVALIAVVGLGPEQWLTGMPRFVTTATLFITAATITILMRRASLTPILASIPISIGWATLCLASDNWWESGSEFFGVAICRTLVATTITLMFTAELLRWSNSETNAFTARRLSKYWWNTIATYSLSLGVVLLFCISSQYKVAAFAACVSALALHLVVFRGLLPKWAGVAIISAWGAALLSTHAVAPNLFQFEELSLTVNSILIAIAELGFVLLVWQVLRILQSRNHHLHRWLVALSKDRLQVDGMLSTLLTWGYVTAALLNAAAMTVVLARDREDVIFASSNLLLGFTAAVGCLLIIKRILVFNPLRSQKQSSLMVESRDDFALTATMFGFSAPLLLLGSTFFTSPSSQLLVLGWTTVILITSFVATSWWLRKSTLSTNAPALYPQNAILLLNVIGSLIVGGICIAFPVNSQWQSFDQLANFSWLHASLIGLPILLVAQMVMAAEFTKSRTLAIAYQVLAIAAGPYIAHILVTDNSLPVAVLAAISSALIVYLATTPLTRFAKATIASQFGLSLLTVALAAWTVVALANGTPSIEQSWGSMKYWLIVYLLGAALFISKSGQSWIGSTSLRVVTAVASGAGLIAMALMQMDFLGSANLSLISGSRLLGSIWLAVAGYAAVEGFISRNMKHATVATGLIIAVNALCIGNAIVRLPGEWLWGLAAVALSSIGLVWYGVFEKRIIGQVISVVGTGSLMLLVTALRPQEPSVAATLCLIAAATAVVWSLYEFFVRPATQSQRRAAGIISGLSGFVLLLASIAVLQLFHMQQSSFMLGSMASIITLGIAIGCGLGCYVFAPNRLNSTPLAFLSSLLLAALTVTSTTAHLSDDDRWAWIVIACTCVAGLWVWSWPIARGFLFANLDSESLRQQYRLSCCIGAAAVMTVVAASFAVFTGNTELSRSLSIASVLGFAGIVGISFGWWRATGEMQKWGVKSLPTFAVLLFTSGLGLAAVGLAPSEDPTGLITIMRLFIASVVLTPTMLWIARFAFALRGPEWEAALRRGAYLGVGLAAFSLCSMFVGELLYRGDAQLAQLPTSLILGVAALLSLACAFCSACAIFPESVKATTGQLDERQRTIIIFVAQLLGGLIWVHLVLCRPQFAFVGLRPYWPFTVMLLAFLSAGITQFARWRKDEVLERAMKKSTFLLPLIPVIGFWIARHEASWLFMGERSSYSLLLFVGALFYGSLAIMWPQHKFPRVLGILLGNGALWVLLAQTPSLSFLTHPQIWLIPPAVCVLAATFLEQKHVPSKLLSPIRYGALFVVYISSTADILLVEAGASFWRPIILIMLALFGMTVGIVARTRAFLYLGTLFVFIGVLSMVWQAGRAIDQSWPWWVFGITLGIIMLAGLTYLEKNRATLKRLATDLSAWQP